MKMMQSMFQVYDLNLELLDVLTTTLSWIQKYCDKHNIPLRTEDSLYQLITLSRKVMKEIDVAEINLAKSSFFLSDEVYHVLIAIVIHYKASTYEVLTRLFQIDF